MIKRNSKNEIVGLPKLPDDTPFYMWYEVADCMSCGRNAVLHEGGNGAHVCRYGCGNSDVAPDGEWIKEE